MTDPFGHPVPFVNTTALEHWEGEAVKDWEQAWKVPVLEAFRSLPSTNDRLKELAATGAAAWTVVLSEAQTRGRGRGGKSWDSAPGMGLWVSLLLPSSGTGADALLPIRVGLALVRVLDRLEPGVAGAGDAAGAARAAGAAGDPGAAGNPGALGAAEASGPILLKWPNDLLLSRRKVGGILCESLGSVGVVVGLGLNVRQRPQDFPPSLRALAISLEEGWGLRIDRGTLTGDIVGELRRMPGGTMDRLRPVELEAFAARDALLGKPIWSELEGVGVGAGITARGFLVLERDGGGRCEIRGGSVRRLAD